jgi:hypothetical protein
MSIRFHGAPSRRIAVAAGVAALGLLPASGALTSPAAPDGAPSAKPALTAARGCKASRSKPLCRKVRTRRYLQTHV